MNRRAAQALRLIAVVGAVAAALDLVSFGLNRWLTWLLWQRPHSSTDVAGSVHLITHRFEALWAIQRWSIVATTVLTLIGIAWLFSTMGGRGRALATGALVAATVGLALMVFDQLVPAKPVTVRPYRISALRQSLGLVRFFASNGSCLLVLLAAMAAAPAGRAARRATVAFVVLSAALLLFKIVHLVSTGEGASGAAFQYAWYGVAVAASVAFVLGAAWLARDLGRTDVLPAAGAIAPGAIVPGRQAAGPFRLFGQTIIVRIAVGVPLTIAATAATAAGSTDVGLVAFVASTIASVVAAAMLVVSLVGQRRLPEVLCDRGALTAAIALACLAPVLDVWGALATGDLLSMVAEARNATSFWGAPSLGHIEDLQAVATWTGRVSVCLGLAASFAILRSLAATAFGLGDQTLMARARRARALLVWGSGGAVTAWIVVSNELRGEGGLLLLVTLGVGLLTIGVVLVGEMLRLAYGLAAALEFPAPPAGPPEVSSVSSI